MSVCSSHILRGAAFHPGPSRILHTGGCPKESVSFFIFRKENSWFYFSIVTFMLRVTLKKDIKDIKERHRIDVVVMQL